MRRGTVALAVLCTAGVAGGGWAALAAGDDAGPAAAAPPPAATATPAPEQPPLPKARPRVVEPVAGAAAGGEDTIAAAGPPEGAEDRAPTDPASVSKPRGDAPTAVRDAVRGATALPNGVALPPLEAPPEVLRIIEAGNAIARSPYKWGGGHGRWVDTGYDCSGSVSFALAAAGLLGGPLDSSGLMRWGAAGRGKWVTVYANPGHVWMEVAGLRFDTSGARQTGSRWQNDLRGPGGYTVRHPPGL